MPQPTLGQLNLCPDAGGFAQHCGAGANCGAGGLFTKEYCDESSLVVDPTDLVLTPYNITVARIGSLIPQARGDYGPQYVGFSEHDPDRSYYSSPIHPRYESGPPPHSVRPHRTIATFFPGEDTRYGARLHAAGSVACTTGAEMAPVLWNIAGRQPCLQPPTLNPSSIPCNGRRCDVMLHAESVDRYGPRYLFGGMGTCQRVNTIPEPQYLPFYRVNMFGQEAWYCPWMLLTVQEPCLNCSWDYQTIASFPSGVGVNCSGLWGDCIAGEGMYHGPQYPEDVIPFYWCPDQPNNDCAVGRDIACDVECKARIPLDNGGILNPDWRVGCSFGEDGQPDSHHCEDCEWARLIGKLVTEFIRKTHATRRLPLYAMVNEESYGCNQFGFALSKPDGVGYLPLDMTWYDEPAQETLWPFGWKFEGSCGTGMLLQCPDPPFPAYAPIMFARPSTKGRPSGISEARVHFKAIEAYDPENDDEENGSLNPCHKHPDGCTPENYYNPSTTQLVQVDASIRLFFWVETILVTHLSMEVCDDPYLYDTWVQRMILVTGRTRMIIPWGNFQSGWLGYPMGMAGEFVQGGWQWSPPGSNCPDDPDGSPALGWAGNVFVNQGKVTDWDGAGYPYHYRVPPKQVPTFVIRDTARDQFFCSPAMKWIWSIGNQANYRPQCWDIEPMRNEHGCIDGAETPGLGIPNYSLFHSGRYECTKLECRRGCDIGEAARDARLDLDCRPEQPCRDPIHTRFARPWSMGQCIDTGNWVRGFHQDIGRFR